jgi:hypothetical protein
MSNLLIPTELAQAIHDYLLTKPMGEVETLVVQIRALRPAPAAEEPKE